MKNIKLTLAIVSIGILQISGCKKEELKEAPVLENHSSFNKSISSNLTSLVSYNSQLQMLEFPDKDAFNSLADIYYNEPVLDDGGNKEVIMERLNDCTIFGITNSQGANFSNEVNINELEELLIVSTPLSDEVLIKIINSHSEIPQGFPSNFLLKVFSENYPVSDSVIAIVDDSDLGVNTKNIIISKNENKYLVPDYSALLVEKRLNFRNSLRKQITEAQEIALKNGIDPESTDYPKSSVADEFLITVLNDKYEVKIGKSIFKYLNPCGLIEITNADINTLNYIQKTDNIPIAPVENELEPEGGYPIQQINVYAPESVLVHDIHNLQNGTLETSSNTCSNANFAAVFNSQTFNGIRMKFINGSVGTGTLTYTWNFGDGTGSFQANPFHVYNNPGVYNVTLTVWGEKCCKSIYRQEVRAVDATCTAEFTSDINGLSVALTNQSFYAGNITPPSYEWTFGDNSPTSIQENPTQLYLSPGTYSICLKITVDNCINTICKDVTVSESTPPDCCDNNDRVKNQFHHYDGGNRKFEYKIWMTNIAYIYHAVGTKVENYKKKNNGNWKHEKADEISVNIGGIAYSKPPFSSECDPNGAPTNASDQRSNRSSLNAVRTNWGFPANNRISAKENSIISNDGVKFNGNYVYPTCCNNPSLSLADCD